jgi:membrane protease subunit (stomatin/prohibitin family)
MGQMMGNMMNQNAGGQGQAVPANDPAARIAKLKGLLDQGLINAEEFEAKKKEILSSI